VRALVVDDNEPFRVLVVALLRDVAAVVEQAPDGDTAVRMARELRPDIVVMDISMPRLDGISAARAIQLAVPSARIVFLSGTRDAAEAP
jgi:two-component system, chemotaxis family, protein-glutamate methylesterase/glutaminase